MTRTEERLEFAPPRDKASLRAFGLALLVHALLIAALTWGVSWKRTDDAASFEAEVWSGAPQPAAPQENQTQPALPPPSPPPAPEPILPPPPPPAPPAAKTPEIKETPPLPEVDIALEKEKKRKLLQQQKEAEVLKAQKLQEKREAELQARQAKEQERKKEQEKQAREDLAERKTRDAANEKEKRTAAANAAAAEKQKEAAAEKQKQAAAEKQKAAAAATAAANAERQKEAAAAAAAAKQKAVAEGAEKARQAANQKRIMDMAAGTGGTGGSSDAGSAKANGPSAGYAGKVKARVLPNVVFNDDIAGNPKAEVEVRTTADGTIMSQRLITSSGSKAWDDAVIKAIIRTGSLPRDVDGRVPTPMIIEFRPN